MAKKQLLHISLINNKPSRTQNHLSSSLIHHLSTESLFILLSTKSFLLSFHWLACHLSLENTFRQMSHPKEVTSCRQNMCTEFNLFFPLISVWTVPIDNEPRTNADEYSYYYCVPLIIFRSGACSVDAYYPCVTIRITFTWTEHSC